MAFLKRPDGVGSAHAPLRISAGTAGEAARVADQARGVNGGDPLKPDEAVSDTQRKNCNDWFDGTLYARLNSKRDGCIILIMQRLHEDDLSGHVLGLEPWEIISFPAIAEVGETHHIHLPSQSYVHNRLIGEAHLGTSQQREKA